MKMPLKLKYPHINRYNRVLGFGILEVFISFSLGIIIIVLMWRVLLIMNHNWVNYNEKMQLQQNAQTAIDIITTDLINSSYMKYSKNTVLASTIKTNTTKLSWMTYFHAGILGIPQGSKQLKAIDSQAKSEAVAVFYLNADAEAMVANYENGFLYTSGNNKYSYQDLLALINKDKDQLTLFTAGSMSYNNKIHIAMNSSAALQNCTINFKGSFTCNNNLESASKLNMLGGTILKQEGYIYYLRYSNKMPNLYRKKLGLTKSNRGYNAEALVEGIEQLSIWYKYTDGDNSGYFRANDLGDDINQWQQVTAICLEIVARSRTEAAKAPMDYFFANKLHTPKDKYIRQTYSTTIAIRNKI